MTRIIGIFLLVAACAAAVFAADYWSGSGFLNIFMKERATLLMGTMLAVYIATASAFLTILLKYEEQQKRDIFNSLVPEIKQNVTFVMVLFPIHFFLLAATPQQNAENHCILNILMFVKVLVFFLYIFAICELSRVLFGVRDTINSFRRKN